MFLSGLQIRPARPQDLRPALAQARPGLHLKSLSAGRDFGGPASCRPAGPSHLGALGGSRLALFLRTVLYTSSRFHDLCCCFRVSRYPHFPYYELAPVNAKYVCPNFPQLAIDMLFLQLLADELRSCESIRYRCLYFAFVFLRLRSRRL